jgi:putative OPT family oligopeptide transporter
MSGETMRPFKEQFTLRGMVLGAIGAAIITASSIYVALKLGALPWPIFFVTLFAFFALKALRKTNLNEVNVAATAMSAGAMVAGGIAYVVPGIFMLYPDATISIWTIFACALSGVILGLVFTALVRRRFIEQTDLPYPIGQGAAAMLKAGDEGGHKARILFVSMGVAGLFTVLRDWFGAIPSLLFSKVSQYLPGVSFGIYASPMALAIGFMLEPLQVLVWLLGALFADFGLVVGGAQLGLWDTATGSSIKTSLGIGVMIGLGVGVIVKIGGGWLLRRFKQKAATAETHASAAEPKAAPIIPLKVVPFMLAAVVLILTVFAGIGLLPSLLLVFLTWVVVFIAAQCVGQAGLDPLEVFGLLVLLVIAFICQVGGIEAFLICTVAAVACGLCGDVMNDFKAGHLLGSNPKAQWYAELIGGVVGALVGTLVISMFISAYGIDCFGTGKEFTAAQASAIASMIGGVSNVPAFVIGVIGGAALFLIGAPVLTLGLGIYLPFYLSLTVSLGMLIRLVCEKVAPKWFEENGNIVASGLLGGESVVGVIIALVAVATGLSML